MENMKRKAISVMLSAALIAGTLAGCGSDNSDSTESTAVESTAGDSTESADSSDGETEGSSKYKDLLQLMYLTAWQTIRESSLAGLQKS